MHTTLIRKNKFKRNNYSAFIRKQELNSKNINYENGNNVKFWYNNLLILNYLTIILLFLNITTLFLLQYFSVKILYDINLIINFTTWFIIILFEFSNYKYLKEKLLIDKFLNYVECFVFYNKINYLNLLTFFLFPLKSFENYSLYFKSLFEI